MSSDTQTPTEMVAEMSEAEKDRLLRRVARDTDDERIAEMCELGLQSREDTTS